MRRLLLVLGVTLVVGLSGAAAASVLASSPSPSASSGKESPVDEAGTDESATEAPAAGEPGGSQDAGVHGGPVERFTQADSCGLTDTSALHGNWTHGDYVSAVAAAGGNQGQIQKAAHSDCGKPMAAVNHAGGPPAHALANKNAAHEHQADKANDESPASSGD